MSPSSAAPVRRRPAPATRPRPGTAPRHLRVAPEIWRRRRRARLAMWGLALLTVASIFVLVAFHVVAVQHTFQLDRLARERANEELRYERLREQVATLSAPDAIVAAAQKMGMQPASSVTALQAPQAAPRGTRQDPTADTLGKSWDEAKRHLGADP
jgi:cell division protein FtsL